MTSREAFREFLDWFDQNRDNLPDWVDMNMSLHALRLLWLEKMGYVTFTTSETENVDSTFKS